MQKHRTPPDSSHTCLSLTRPHLDPDEGPWGRSWNVQRSDGDRRPSSPKVFSPFREHATWECLGGGFCHMELILWGGRMPLFFFFFNIYICVISGKDQLGPGSSTSARRVATSVLRGGGPLFGVVVGIFSRRWSMLGERFREQHPLEDVPLGRHSSWEENLLPRSVIVTLFSACKSIQIL